MNLLPPPPRREHGARKGAKKKKTRFLVQVVVVVVVVVVRLVREVDASECEADAAEALAAEGLEKLRAGDEKSGYELLEAAEAADEWNANALVQLGRRDLLRLGEMPALADVAFSRLYKAFDARARPKPAPIASPAGAFLAAIAARAAVERQEYVNATNLIEPLADLARRGVLPDDCARLQLATLVQPFAESVQKAGEMLEKAAREARALLSQRGTPVKVRPYDHQAVGNDDQVLECLLTPFHYSFYYEADARESLVRWIHLALKAWPELRYSAPRFFLDDGHKKKDHHGREKDPGVKTNTRVGVASAFFAPKSSVMADFGGVLVKLAESRRFDMTYVAVQENSQQQMTPFLKRASLKYVRVIVVRKTPGWLAAARVQIAALDLDVLLYLDLTMSPMTTRLAMSRLARVQATTHGHPMTSGIDDTVMHYFISWAAAEAVPEAHEHYSERLILLPADAPHVYWSRRALDDPDAVAIDDIDYAAVTEDWRALSREDLAAPSGSSFFPPIGAHWYVCMQKPFKLHPKFDAMLAGIHQADPAAHLVLHAIDNPANRAVVERRYAEAGVDLDRVAWLPSQSRSRLLALYHLADVLLDSYYASGCTTSREALEVFALPVTLPAKYLGSRWTLALYRLLGVRGLVARDPDDYVRIAVKMATDPTAFTAAKAKVASRVHALYHRHDAVQLWADLLDRLAATPVPPRANRSFDHLLQPYDDTGGAPPSTVF